MDRVVKSISFKLSDPGEADLFKHAAQSKNFSQYIKRLIAIDMGRGLSPIGIDEEPKKEAAEDTQAAMQSFF